jgi:soluble lytic murein transglycosylase-like protein
MQIHTQALKGLSPGRLRATQIAAIVLAVLASPAAAAAQVLEIGDTGAVTLYDRPSALTPGLPPAGRRLSSKTPSRPGAAEIRVAVIPAAQSARLSEALIEAIAWRESRFQAGAVSRAGALGEMQLMPATARRLGVDPHDSRQNVFGGAAYIRALMERYDGDVIKTLAAYNAGPGAVDHYGGVPPFRETKAYVADILEHLSKIALQDPGQEQK